MIIKVKKLKLNFLIFYLFNKLKIIKNLKKCKNLLITSTQNVFFNSVSSSSGNLVIRLQSVLNSLIIKKKHLGNLS